MKIQKILILLFLCKINIVFGVIKHTDFIVALVNHHIILDSDIRKNLKIYQNHTVKNNEHLSIKTTPYQEMLNQLIAKTLIFNAANQENILAENQQIDHTINDILHLKKMTSNQLDTYLNHINLDYKQYYSQIRQDITNNKICNNIVYQRAHISPNEINEIAQTLNIVDYNKQFEIIHIIYPLPIQATTEQIMITENLAKSLIKQDKKNNDIVKLINTYNSKNHIFQTIKIQQKKWISWKDMPIIFDQYLQNTNINNIIGPIRSHDGIHILKIQDTRYQKFTFPITKIKIRILTLKNSKNEKITIENLLKIKKSVENGNTTFNIVAQSKSKNSCIIHHKEYLQWNDLDTFEPKIQQIIKNLKKNEISAPTYISFNWCLIQLIDINTIDYYTMIRDRAYCYLLNKKFNTIINNWIQELKSMSYIKINN